MIRRETREAPRERVRSRRQTAQQQSTRRGVRCTCQPCGVTSSASSFLTLVLPAVSLLSAATPAGQENVAPMSARAIGKANAAAASAAAAGEVTKPGAVAANTRFGFRAPAALTAVQPLAATQQAANAGQQTKRRRTNDGAVAQQQEASNSAIPSTPSGPSTSSNGFASPAASPAAAASSSSATSNSIPAQAFAAPAAAMATLWREVMMDDTLASECRSALANKITAGKFDYKERMGQLEAQMKSVRKVVSTLTKRQDVFLQEAAKIEAGLNERVAQEFNRAREAMIERVGIQEKAMRSLQLVKQLQAQRDGLMSDAQTRAAQLTQHASVLDAAQALQQETEEKLAQSNKDLADTMALLDQTTLEREESKKIIVEMQETLESYSSQINALEDEKSTLTQTNEEQSQGLKSAAKAHESMESALAATREQYVALMSQWSALQKSFEKGEETIVALNGTIATLRGELTTAQEALESSRAEVAAGVQAAAEAKARAATELAGVRSAMQGELAALKLSLDSALARNAQETTLLNSNVEQLSAAKSSLLESANRAQLEVATLRTSLLHATEKVGSLELEARKTEGDLALLKVQLNQKNEECFVTVSSFANIQKFHEERQTILQNEKEALEKRALETQTRVHALEASVKNTTQSLEVASTSLAERTRELEALKADHERSLAQSKEDREAWEVTQNELKESLATLTAQSAATISKLESEVSDLTAKHATESERATTLQRELTSFKALSGVSSESQMENLVKLSMEAETLRMQVKDKGELAQTLMDTKRQLAEALRRVTDSEHTRRQLHNTIQELKGNIRVFTRVRPMLQAGSKNDVNSGETNTLTGEDQINAIDVSADGKRVRLDAGNGTKSNYTFDAVFGPATTQQDVFHEISQLVQSALDGYHVCLFSYGQTGSGKTHTMSGSVSGPERGIIPRSAEKVFEQAQQLSTGGWTYNLEASFLEIYNEMIRDLLCKDSKESDLDIKRDPSGRTNIPGLTRCVISNINDVATLMNKAAKNRATASTNMNERSSRSHSVFTLYLTASNPLSKQSLSGSLNLCDLAGSERLSKSGASGDRMKETQSINKSLSSLSDVFLALSQKQAHVPFRNSKLTYLLQPCLSGDGKTAMIINLNPSLSSSNESLCTLRFAAQVSQVELAKPKKQAKSTTDDSTPMDCSPAAPASSSSVASTPRLSLSGSQSASNLMRPTASSGVKKPSTAIPRPTTGTAMRR